MGKRKTTLREAAAAVAEHWAEYDTSEWGPEDPKGVRLLRNLRRALAARSQSKKGARK